MAATGTSGEIDERSHRLHAESFGFGFGLHGESIPQTERTRAAMRGALQGGGLAEAQPQNAQSTLGESELSLQTVNRGGFPGADSVVVGPSPSQAERSE